MAFAYSRGIRLIPSGVVVLVDVMVVMSDMSAIIVTVVRDWAMYDELVRTNKFCEGAVFAPLDNSVANLPVPVRYNSFLESYDYSHDAWFVFCHEDFEFLENISEVAKNFDVNALYGPIGHIRVGLLGFGVQRVRGEILATRKGESHWQSWKTGRHLTKPARVETFDCCCLMVHSSLVKRLGLRFDEKLEFDMYVEDFCASAYERYNVLSYAFQMKVCHHSDSPASDRLWRHLPYLADKYKSHFYTGTLAYFGTPSWQKRLQDCLVAFVRRLFLKGND